MKKLLILLLLSNIHIFAANTRIYYYNSRAISLKNINRTTAYSMWLQGTTNQRILYARIVGNRKKTQVFLRINNGRFNASYLFQHGPGTYTVTLFGTKGRFSCSFMGLCKFKVTATRRVPQAVLKRININPHIVNYARRYKGKKIDRGECWDLARRALDYQGAIWNRLYGFGKKLTDVSKAKPGDIIHFYRVKIFKRFPSGRWIRRSIGAPHHVAIIEKVLSKKKYVVLHQNVNRKRYVLRTTIDLNDVTSGRFTIYRPVPGLVYK